MKFLIDLEMDGYNSREEMRAACIEYINDQLDSSGTTVRILSEESYIPDEEPRE